MNIIETNLQFRSMSYRSRTNRLILHHADASVYSPEQIHQLHLQKGWSGAGYHFEVRKDGSIYRLRPEGAVGAHASGGNSDSIGICFEGDYDVEIMPDVQKQAEKELEASLVKRQSTASSKVQGSQRCYAQLPAPAQSSRLRRLLEQAAVYQLQPHSRYRYQEIAELQNECNVQGFLHRR